MNEYVDLKEFLPLTELSDRRVYNLLSRNLAVGVWNAKTGGFIGIRQKFNEKYLFTEYFYGATSGTAHAVSAYDVDVPAEIELVEVNPTVDATNGRPVFFDGQVHSGGRGWIYVDTEEPIEGRPISHTNQELFDFLSPYDAVGRLSQLERYETD